jgi:hypothetical protein
MGRSAVELHGDSLFAPQGVDPNAANPAVDFGRRNSGLLAEVEEALLEDAEGLYEARSRSVRLTGVTRKPRCSTASTRREWWIRTSGNEERRAGVVRWMRVGSESINDQIQAAVVWLSTAPVPAP